MQRGLLVAMWAGWAVLIAVPLCADEPLPDVVEFNRDIRSILADNCYACHGPDNNKREADLRLDREEDALAQRDEGRPIVPGRPDESLVVRRLLSNDPEERMPPGSSGKAVTPRQIE